MGEKIISGEQHKSGTSLSAFFFYFHSLYLSYFKTFSAAAALKHLKSTSFTWSKRQSFIPI
jgi:hypothetical protein